MARRETPVRQAGFTYLGLLFAVAIAGAGLAAVGIVWHADRQRGKEAELLFIGNEFRRAIALYYYRTPGQAHEYPRSLDDLIEDGRFPGVQRYLRRVYRDPMTGKAEWGLVLSPGGRIMGVHSLSKERPLKVEHSSPANREFTDKRAYYEWEFVFVPVSNVPSQLPHTTK